jgi:hypothetical protein
MKDWPLSASVKFIGLNLVVMALLIVSYQIFVRYMPIGWTVFGGWRFASITVVMMVAFRRAASLLGCSGSRTREWVVQLDTVMAIASATTSGDSPVPPAAAHA